MTMNQIHLMDLVAQFMLSQGTTVLMIVKVMVSLNFQPDSTYSLAALILSIFSMMKLPFLNILIVLKVMLLLVLKGAMMVELVVVKLVVVELKLAVQNQQD